MPRQQSGIGLFGLLFVGGFFLLFGWMFLQQAGGLATTAVQPSRLVNYESLWDSVAVYDLPQPGAQPLAQSRAGEIDTGDGEIAVHLEAHAEAHGAEAELARQCFSQHGTLALFKFGFDDRFARLCQYDDGWIVVQFLKRIAEKEYIEVSAYVPHLTDASLVGVRDWLLRCGFTLFKGALP